MARNPLGELIAMGILAVIGAGLFLVVASSFGTYRKGDEITEEEAEDELETIEEGEIEEEGERCEYVIYEYFGSDDGCSNEAEETCGRCHIKICRKHVRRCFCGIRCPGCMLDAYVCPGCDD